MGGSQLLAGTSHPQTGLPAWPEVTPGWDPNGRLDWLSWRVRSPELKLPRLPRLEQLCSAEPQVAAAELQGAGVSVILKSSWR